MEGKRWFLKAYKTKKHDLRQTEQTKRIRQQILQHLLNLTKKIKRSEHVFYLRPEFEYRSGGGYNMFEICSFFKHGPLDLGIFIT